jgi:hypothetical protein
MVLMQGCWVMGFCVDQEACDKYGTPRGGSSTGSCTGTKLLGTWTNGIANQSMIFQTDCDFSGSFSATCQLSGTFTSNDALTQPTVTFKVKTSNSATDATCPVADSYTCDYTLSSTAKLSFSNCDTGFGTPPLNLSQ